MTDYLAAFEAHLTAAARREGYAEAVLDHVPDTLDQGRAEGWRAAIAWLDTVDAMVCGDVWAHREPPPGAHGASLILWALEVAADALEAEGPRRFGETWATAERLDAQADPAAALTAGVVPTSGPARGPGGGPGGGRG